MSQSLAGRTALLKLLPLSVVELAADRREIGRDDCIFRGFMPGIHEAEIQPPRFYSSYYQTYVERDVRQFANIRDLIAFETFVRLLAGRVGQLVNMSDLSNSVGLSSTTLTHWLGILEASFIVFRLPPYYENFGKRLVKTPKIYFTEPALAAYLLGIRKAEQVGTNPALGGLFENLVVVEAAKAFYNKGEEPELYFFRDSHGLEADLLVRAQGGLWPVEIKATRSFSPELSSSIARIRRLDPRLREGRLVYAGDREHEFQGTHLINFRSMATFIQSLL